MTYQLRPHQERAINLIRHSFTRGNRCPVLQASTGFGKTLIAVDIIKQALAKGKRVLFVVDRVQLIDQTSEVFDNHNLHHGVIQADHWRVNSEPLQLASVQTLTRRKHKPMVDLVIVDEAHCMYESLSKLITHTWNNLPFIGLSATPFTKGMGTVYDDLIVVETTQSLIDKGYLCDFIAYGSTQLDLSGIKTQAGDYNQKQLGERVNQGQIVGDVVSTWLKRGENRKTVCFAVNVAHSKSIVDEFLANGVSAAHIDAYTDSDDRDAILAKHDSGEIKILSNVGITTKGWDSPETSCLILARPTKSLMLYIQMVGRVLRTAEGKENAIILDHGRNIERLGFPTDDLPEYLCNGDMKERKKREAKEKEEKLPTPCPKCSYMSTAFVCPSCGHEPEIKPEVSVDDGELSKLEKTTSADKKQWYAMFLYHTRSKGFKDGAASYLYRDKFGVWPAWKRGIEPIPPSKEVSGFITHVNIKKRHKKKAKEFLEKPMPGFIYSKQFRNDGELIIRCEKEGKFQGWARQTPEIMDHLQ